MLETPLSTSKGTNITNHKRIVILAFLLLIASLGISCSGATSKPSPETTAEAFMQATSEGDLAGMQELAVSNSRNNPESLSWFASFFTKMSISDLTFQQSNANPQSNAYIYYVYQGTKEVATIHVTQIGDQYYVHSATTTLWLDQ